MAKSDSTRELKTYVDCLRILNPIGHRNLTLVPLGGEAIREVDYILGSRAMKDALLTVKEISRSGSVNELSVTNRAERKVLLIDGEELVGAKQNRILNTTVLLSEKTETTIPVSCVEQGRWRYTTAGFTSGSYSPPKMRAMKSRSVKRSLRREGRASGDQSEVWSAAACLISEHKVSSPTMAMKDVFEIRRRSIDAYIDALEYPIGARGLLAAINGEFIALDMFDKASTLEEVWGRLVAAYAVDALPRASEGSKPFTADGAKSILSYIPHSELSVHSGVCLVLRHISIDG